MAAAPARPPSPPRRPPAELHRCPPPGWGEATRERQPRRRYFYSSPDLCGARPLPCRALPSGCISALAGANGAARLSPPPAPPPARAGPCARSSARGSPRGQRGAGDTTTGAPQADKMAVVCECQRCRVSSQPACPPLASQTGARCAPRCALRSEPCPGPQSASPAAAGRAPSWGQADGASVCVPVPGGCPLRTAGPRASPLFCGAGKGCGAKRRQPERFVIRLCKKDSGA